MSETTNTTRLLANLTTEQVDPRYARIDQLPVSELAALMNEADQTVPLAVREALPQIVPAIEAVSAAMERGGRLIYVGAGTPGRLAVVDASECPPTFGTPPELVQALIAGGPDAIIRAHEGAEDDAQAGSDAIDRLEVGPDDSVVGIASSGRTPYVVGAVTRAAQRGAVTAGISCNRDTELSAAAAHGIEVEVGPEVIAGSTRLKAGTAQKLVLNMFSTIAMIRLGKTYGPFMVDLRVSNAKLRARAERIVSTVADVDLATAARTLDRIDDVRIAILVLRLGLTEEEARARLAATGGRLREALD